MGIPAEKLFDNYPSSQYFDCLEGRLSLFDGIPRHVSNTSTEYGMIRIALGKLIDVDEDFIQDTTTPYIGDGRIIIGDKGFVDIAETVIRHPVKGVQLTTTSIEYIGVPPEYQRQGNGLRLATLALCMAVEGTKHLSVGRPNKNMDGLIESLSRQNNLKVFSDYESLKTEGQPYTLLYVDEVAEKVKNRRMAQ